MCPALCVLDLDSQCFIALRIEWCQSRAHAFRWKEEVELLQEEMRRILAFLMWQANWWENQSRSEPGTEVEAAEGLIAYALRQADLRRRLHDRFEFAWRNVAEFVKIGDRCLASEPEGSSI